jgi:hypothetical protein
MVASPSNYRFLLIHPFSFPPTSRLSHRPAAGPKESQLPNHAQIKHVLADIDWDLHPGEMGWEIPVLEGYTCAIALAKMLVDLRVSASGLTFPGDRPRRWRRKKTF